mgnify:FL=1|tara:strand:- start:447 stop:1853 length:1407 start_codon:yes stop_codon:yes gene_type:complete
METLQRTANRGSVSTGYDVANSLKFEDDNDERMNKAISSTNQRTFTISFWLKRTELGYRRTWGAGASGNDEFFFYFDANDYLNIYSYTSSAYQLRFISNRRFQDTAAWYHLVFQVDTTQSTEANRFKIYVNGVQETSFSTATYPSQNADLQITNNFYVGTQRNESPDFSGYICEFVYLDGTSAAQTDFGEFDDDTGIWIPKDPSGLTFGTNGFYLDFEDSSNLGNDANGGTDFTLNNITAADQSTDTCTNNFATWLCDGTQFNVSTDNETFKEGGTQFNNRAGTGWTAVYPTQSFAGGKWYMEVKVHTNAELAMYGAMPVARINSLERQNQYHGQDTDGSIGLYGDGGQIYYGTAGSGGLGSSVSAGDIIGLAIDMENYKMYFAVNNTYVESGNPAGNSNGRDIEQEPYVFSIAKYSPNEDTETNFGGYTVFSNTHTNTDDNGFGNFVYAPPSGFLALCTKNLAETGG